MGEPSYISKIGCTVRFDWKAKYPDQYCIYFNCKTPLIETFKKVYSDTFPMKVINKTCQDVPFTELAHCISLLLCYKKVKHLNLFGA